MPDQSTERVATSEVTDGGSSNSVSTSEVIVAANDSRVAAIIQPVDGDIYVRYGSAATVAAGIKVVSGASLEERDYTGAIYAIASAGTVDVRVIEVG